MGTLLQDIRIGGRKLVRRPTFTAIAILVLALGIGANTAVFSIVDAIVLRPLPIPEPQRVVTLWQTDARAEGDRSTVSFLNFLDWEAQGQSFESMGAYSGSAMTLTGHGEPTRLRVGRVSSGFFGALGVAPTLGRDFREEEDRSGEERVVILSEGLWKRVFGADPGLLGSPVTLDGQRHAVVGVVAAPPDWPQPLDAWIPLALTPAELEPGQRRAQYLEVVARLRGGVTLREAQAEMTTIAARLAEQFPETNAGQGAAVVALHELVVGDVQKALLVLLGAVGFVLLIACANVGGLMLTQAHSCQREIALRVALGAGQSRIIRQLLTESGLIALAGGALGLLAAQVGLEALVGLAPAGLPRAHEIAIDGRVLAFTGATAVLTALLFGLAPAIMSSRVDVQPVLKEGGRTSVGGTRRLGGALVVAEVALSVVLLAGAGLLIRSFWQLQQVEPGFDARNVLMSQLYLSEETYPGRAEQSAFAGQLLEPLQQLPGTEAAGIATTLPLSGWSLDYDFRIEGRPEPLPGQEPDAGYDSVSPAYFRALGIPLKAGRVFTRFDDVEHPPVVIVSEALARRYWPDESPVGRRVRLEGQMREIVGVVGDVRHSALDEAVRPRIYTPFAQRPWPFARLVVRTHAEAPTFARELSAAIHALDPGQPASSVRPLDTLLTEAMAQHRFRSLLLAVFAGAALLLAALGLYGIIAHGVAQRTPEIGLRMALGAQTGDVFRTVLGQGMLLATVGLGAGLAAAIALARLLSSLLFGVGSGDPGTFAVAALVLMLVSLLAVALPARRATAVDPVEALRHE